MDNYEIKNECDDSNVYRFSIKSIESNAQLFTIHCLDYQQERAQIFVCINNPDNRPAKISYQYAFITDGHEFREMTRNININDENSVKTFTNNIMEVLKLNSTDSAAIYY